MKIFDVKLFLVRAMCVYNANTNKNREKQYDLSIVFCQKISYSYFCDYFVPYIVLSLCRPFLYTFSPPPPIILIICLSNRVCMYVDCNITLDYGHMYMCIVCSKPYLGQKMFHILALLNSAILHCIVRYSYNYTQTEAKW